MTKLPEGMTKRGPVYWADFQVKGRRIRRGLSRNLKTAKQLMAELRARAQRGDFGLLDNDYPIKRLRASYLRHCRQTKKPGTVQRYEYSLQAILSFMPPKVSHVNVEMVLQYREQRLAGGASPRTVNMDVGTLAAMFRWAVSPANLIGKNPLEGIDPLPHDYPKEGRAFERDEVDRLLEASPQPWRDIWYAFLTTGMRKSELASLRFSDIDWRNRELCVQRGVAKNHNARRIPIDDRLWGIVCRQRDGRAARQPGTGKTAKLTAQTRARFTREHVFTTTQNTPLTHGSGLWKALMRCCGRAGIQTRTLDAEEHEIDHVDVHSLRKTFATDLIESGADPKTVQELLGHKTLAMTMELYAKVRRGTARQAVGRLSYGAGSQAPDHVVEFTPKEKIPRNIPTVSTGTSG